MATRSLSFLSDLFDDRLDGLRWLVTLVPACAVLLVEVLHFQVLGEAAPNLAGTALACGLALVVSYVAARVAFGALNRARSAAQARSHELEALDTIVRERERLSRELHDGTAQLLTYLLLRTETVGQLVAADRRSEALAELEGLRAAADDLYVDVRESISGLRTQVVERGLAATLREYAAEFGERHDIEVGLDLDEMPPVPPLVAFHLFRVAQEALANVRKHAHGRHAWLAIRCSAPARLTLSVADDGHGFDPGAGGPANEGGGRRGFGLETMRERADALGGSLHIESWPGEGTRVSVSVPVQRTP